MPTETGVTSILGIENKANKNQPNGYAGLDAAGHIPAALGAELSANRNAANGYAGLDASGYVPANETGNMSLIPIAVMVYDVTEGYQIPGTHYYAPFIDDAPTFSNLIFVSSGHYIAFDGSLQCINMRKI